MLTKAATDDAMLGSAGRVSVGRTTAAPWPRRVANAMQNTDFMLDECDKGQRG